MPIGGGGGGGGGGAFNGGTITNPLLVETVHGDPTASAAVLVLAPTDGISSLVTFIDNLVSQNGMVVNPDGSVSMGSAGTAGIPSLSVGASAPGNEAFEVTGGKVRLRAGTTVGFFGATPAAQQTLTSGTATPEQIALALQASTFVAGT